MWNRVAAPDYAIQPGLRVRPYNPTRVMVKHLLPGRTADCRDFDPLSREAVNCRGQRLDHHVHGVSRGVKQGFCVAHEAHMPGPEDEIAALQPRKCPAERQRLADGLGLHVRIARSRDAARGKRELRETRAIQPEAGLAAPEIGHGEEALGY